MDIFENMSEKQKFFSIFTLLCAMLLVSCDSCNSGGSSSDKSSLYDPQASQNNIQNNLLEAPKDLYVNEKTSSEVELLWNHSNNYALEFQVERSETGDKYSKIGTVINGSNSFLDRGLEPDTVYYYRVRAASGEDYSLYSNVLQIQTTALLPCEEQLGENTYYVDMKNICGICNDDYAKVDNTITKPWCSLQQALLKTEPGETVVIKEGIYRGTMSITANDENLSYSIKAYPGDRVVISGLEDVTNWSQYSESIWTTVIDYKPEGLFVKHNEQPVAREPDGMWWYATAVDNKDEGATDIDLSDLNNLASFAHDPAGGNIWIFTSQGDTQFLLPVTSLNSSSGTLSIEKTSQYITLTEGDRYWLENKVSYIDKPGEWAYVKENDLYRIYYCPLNIEDLQKTEASGKYNRVVFGNEVKNIIIDGIEVTGSTWNGIEFINSENVTVKNVLVYNNHWVGLRFQYGQNVTVKNSIFTRNFNGVEFTSSTNGVCKYNDIGYNSNDGVWVTWDSSSITIQKNYIHDQNLWGHPDGIQTYRNVSELYILNNLIMNNGQSIICQETSNGEISGNTLIGSNAHSIIMGNDNFIFDNNTILFSGYRIVEFFGNNYTLTNNIFMTGWDMWLYSISEVSGYSGTNNLFYKSQVHNDKILTSPDGWAQTLEQFQNSVSQELDSLFGNPQFVNAPVHYAVLNTSRIHESTETTWYLRDSISYFLVNDIIEAGFDGIARTVTAVSEDAITVSPGLSQRPIRNLLIANWGTNSNLQWDLQLRSGSPAENLASNGGASGSSINVSQYRSGDFNGDGKRDIPQNPFE